LNGARQTGKSTLAREIGSKLRPARYLTMDDAGVLAAARADPEGFVQGLEGSVILDEVQRVPELFLAIKASVDRDRRPGRFLLTGSADVLLLPRVSESLAGRMEILTLWPLSQGEIEGAREGFLDALFGRAVPSPARRPLPWKEVIERVITGGYPEVLSQSSASRRRAWFGSYITAILQRDVRDLASIESLGQMPRLLALLAARVGSLLNVAELSRSSTLPQTTLKRYLTLFEATFLVQLLPAWSGNLGKRLVKAPKVVLCDSGLTAHLLGAGADRLNEDPSLLGHLLEGFVFAEIKKQSAWSRVRPECFHFRTQTGQEVDLVLEDAAGQVVGIEVKAGVTVTERDFRGLQTLAADAGKRFLRGVVLHAGREPIPFGRNLHALPLDSLWRLQGG
jgi:hypothetical protein